MRLLQTITEELVVELEPGLEPVPLREFLKHERIGQGLSIVGLEIKAGVDHPLYYRYELGLSKKSWCIWPIMAALGIDVVMVKRDGAVISPEATS